MYFAKCIVYSHYYALPVTDAVVAIASILYQYICVNTSFAVVDSIVYYNITVYIETAVRKVSF